MGHRDDESVPYPRDVESLFGFTTISVACGVWLHLAVMVEVVITQFNSSVSLGKLFTRGDGDKIVLVKGTKESQLKPTCVPSFIEHIRPHIYNGECSL